MISTPEDWAKLSALGFCARAVTASTLSDARQEERTMSITNFSRVRYDVASISCGLQLLSDTI